MILTIDHDVGRVPGANDDICSLLAEPFHDGPTDQPSSAHHQYDMTLESEVHEARHY